MSNTVKPLRRRDMLTVTSNKKFSSYSPRSILVSYISSCDTAACIVVYARGATAHRW